MKFEELKTLIAAGLTEEQIKAVNTLYNSPSTPPQSAAVNPPAPAATDTKTNTTTSPQNASAGASEPANETEKMVREMLGLMQKGFIDTVNKAPQKTETAEDVLATILTP